MTISADTVARLRSEISIEGVYAAREIIGQYLPRTPLIRHPLLVESVGCEVYVKHENHLPTGSFKIRGGLNLMAHLSEDDRERGVVTATRGNHGQSIAMASSIHDVRCVVVVPHGNNPEKNAAMRAYGAELVEHWGDFDEAREYAEGLVDEEGLRYLHSANEPQLIHGVGTYTLEILEDLPETDVLVVPVGGGSAISGAITVCRALKPGVEIVGVQAEQAPSVYESWRSKGHVTTKSADTFADGLATRVPFALTLDIIREGVTEMVLVSEQEMREMVVTLIETTHNLAEGAGAAALAAAKKLGPRWAGKRIVAVLSGGNLDTAVLRSLF